MAKSGPWIMVSLDISLALGGTNIASQTKLRECKKIMVIVKHSYGQHIQV
jgi:hypothetical protein